ncbi:MAG TPA: hypothetical protein VFU81_02980, partial [Thermomicrobiales bacterium]|nr:hypothetical protein [Thermomicrobiales bacterium]
MKRIGDMLPTISIPLGPVRRGDSAAPTYACPICKDAGWVRQDVPLGHPNFGRLIPCECKMREQQEKRSETLRRLSNLEAFGQHSFDD